jgi:hypothetical protein
MFVHQTVPLQDKMMVIAPLAHILT